MHEVAYLVPAWLLVVLSAIGALSVVAFAGGVAVAFAAARVDESMERYALTPVASAIADDPLEAWYALGSPVELAEIQVGYNPTLVPPPELIAELDELARTDAAGLVPEAYAPMGFLGEEP